MLHQLAAELDQPGRGTSRFAGFHAAWLGVAAMLAIGLAAVGPAVHAQDAAPNAAVASGAGASGAGASGAGAKAATAKTGTPKTGNPKSAGVKNGAKTGSSKTGNTKTGNTKTSGTKTGNTKTSGTKTGDSKTSGAAAGVVPLSRLPASLELPPLPSVMPPAVTLPSVRLPSTPPSSIPTPSTSGGKADARVIGKLDLPPQADCVIYLRGGEAGMGERDLRTKFHLVEQPAAEGVTSGGGHWLLFPGRAAAEGSGSGKPAIAELRRESDQLTFRWLEAAAAEPAARQLANCVLEISAAQSRRFLPLRLTVKGDPLTFQFQDAMQMRWEVPDAPEPWRVKVELRLASKEPRYRFVGNSTLDASQGTTWIEFMDRRSAEALKLKIECELRGDQLRLQASAFFQAPGEPNPVRLSPATYKRAVERVKAVTTQLEGQLAALAAVGKAAAARDGGKGGKAGGGRGKGGESPADLARKQWEKQLAAAREAAKQLDDLAELQRLVDGRGQLLVRAVVDVEGQLVVLLQADKPTIRAGTSKKSS